NTVKIGRNDLCACGSGKKFKKCCELTQQRGRGSLLMLVLLGVMVVVGLLAAFTPFLSDASHTSQPAGVWSPEHGHYH
ncbi:MAG: SEC-C metal-binding domain-containing protein, partial [Acidobacteria bacterium]|nr:SEC-C metal-binding domain-containing protein [Acidobacteriota bacterium]